LKVQEEMSQNSPKQWFNLEECFFNELDQQLLAKLRSEMSSTETAAAIMKITGISDEKLAKELAAVGVTPETLTAFRLVPLIAVAWADDRLDESEREVVMAAAGKSGIQDGEPAMALLRAWLGKRPPTKLMDAWLDYAKSLTLSLNGELRAVLKNEMMQQVHAVAKASGGVLGFGAESASEKAVIAKVEAALG
jgi:hypothetical protein